MGDYYKIKKILLILIIICTILRIINNSKVFASEAVEVTPQWTDGNYTVQADNNILTLQQNQINIQNAFIQSFYKFLGSNYEANAKDTLERIHSGLSSTSPGVNYGSGVNTRFIWFGRVTTAINGSQAYNFFMQTVQGRSISNSNIVFRDAQLNNGYKLISQPFYRVQRDDSQYLRYFNAIDGTFISANSGEAFVPVAELGVYSTLWVDLFKDYGLITNSGEYESLLQTIQNNQQLVLQQEQVQSAIQRDTNSVVTNSYNYIKDKNVEQIKSLGFTSPDVEEKIDLDDVFDQFETLLTNENYTVKQFSFRLPNDDETIFQISPTMLEDNLTRIGAGYVVQIIHAIWFIALYGWYIFTYFGILGKLISGDWFHLVRSQSPITRMVKFSVGSVTGNVRYMKW